MIRLVGSVVTAALVTLASASAFAQAPSVTPNIEELMRQSGLGGDSGARPRRSGTADPPGVPVPADSPLMTAFQRLESAKAYRVRMEMSTTDERARQSMQQMGMDHFDKAVVKPDTESVTFHMSIPAIDQGGKPDDWEVRSVIKGKRMARKFDTPAKARLLALQEASLAKQMAQADMYASMSIAQAAAGGPMGWVSGAVQLAAMAASHAQAANALKKGREFFEWTCSDTPAGASASHSPEGTTFTDLVDLGERSDGGVSVHGYRFFVRQQGQYHGPVEVDIASSTGLPTRFAMSEPSMGASMVMRYSDYDRPAEIEIPPCLTK
jgi:hypothetical protein